MKTIAVIKTNSALSDDDLHRLHEAWDENKHDETFRETFVRNELIDRIDYFNFDSKKQCVVKKNANGAINVCDYGVYKTIGFTASKHTAGWIRSAGKPKQFEAFFLPKEHSIRIENQNE